MEAVESGAEKEIVIARHGKPAAKLVPIETKPRKRQLGLLNGQFPMMSQEEFDSSNEQIATLFNDAPMFPGDRE